ncbi:MAG: Gfo/Idh/MocA family oxidoreductase [Proteobacteria bacterium]|nr:Gfo/Idh/MocA family oxidoreductase [Pseudomonadota bacterium]
MIRLGMIGFSAGNGHPYSFSAIVNGYDDAAFADCGWPAIHDYLRRRPAEEIGLAEARVVRAWMPDAVMAAGLARACRIERTVDAPEAMLGAVDAVIIARDDADSHFALARPFLEAGLPVFIDKPLTLDAAQLDWFMPYLESGRLMSCSGLRYAVELDSLAAGLGDFGGVLGLRGAVVNDWERYAIHAIEPGLALTGGRARAVRRLAARHGAFVIALADGGTFAIDMLGPRAPVINLSVLGAGRIASIDIRDNFSAFRRCMSAFLGMVASRRPPIDPAFTRNVVRTLIAGRKATPDGSAIEVD